MKKNIKKIFFFLAISVILLIFLQNIVMPKDTLEYTEIKMENFEDDIVKTCDVLFFGTSHMVYGVSPMTIYENTGIVSYNMGTSAQSIEVTYHLLKRVLKCNNPSVIVLDVSSLFFDQFEQIRWHYTMDRMSFNIDKLYMLNEYYHVQNKYANESVKKDSWLSLVFPIIQYHNRWDELIPEDFVLNTDFYYTAGECIASSVQATNTNLEMLNTEADVLKEKNDDNMIESVQFGEEYVEYSQQSLYSYYISDYSKQYLLKIVDMCRKKGVEVILTKIPVMKLPSEYSSAWTQQKSNEVKAFAKENNIEYIDLLYDNKVDIDFSNDTVDGGGHLNHRGAIKVAEYFGNYLKDRGIESKDNEAYSEALIHYNMVSKIAILQSELDFSTYLNQLKERMADSIIMISASNDCVTGLDCDDLSLLNNLGLRCIKKGEYGDSYIAIINKGKVEYEALSNRPLKVKRSIDEKTIEIESDGHYGKKLSSIVVDGKEWSYNRWGLNFVIIDSESGLIIDRVVFDTTTLDKVCIRDGSVFTLLKEYEKQMIMQ